MSLDLPSNLAETLAVFDDAEGPCIPLATSEVADELDLSRRSTYDRLQALVEREVLETKKVGAKGRVWWRPRAAANGGAVAASRDAADPGDAERSRRGQHDQFQSLVEAVEEYAIFMLDPEGHVRTWNQGAERIKGYEREDILGEHFSTFYTEADRTEDVPASNLAAAAAGGDVEDEGWRVRADGSRFWANVTITAIRDDDGVLEGYAKVTRDMTDRREYEEELRRERNLLEQVLEAAPASIGLLDRDGTVLEANARAEELLGLDASSDDATVTGLDVYDEDDEPIPHDEWPYARALEAGEPVEDFHCRIDPPDAGTHWISVDATPLRDDDAGQVIVTFQDVTRLKSQARRLERQRDDLEAELDDVFDRVDDAFFALDDEWRFTHVNERAAEVLDRSQPELVGRDLWDAFPAARDTTLQERYEHAMATQETVAFEEYYPPLDAWLEVTVYPSETGLSVYFRDVTGRKRRERELERYETIVENVGDGIYVVDDDGRFTEMNETFAEMTGKSREELLGAHVSTVIDDEEVLRQAQRFEAELAAGDRETAKLEAELVDDEGRTRATEATFALLASDDGHERVGVVRDVTERRRRERDLERYETIVETVDDGIFAVGDDGHFVLVNDGFCELTGRDREELLGAHATTLYDDEVAPRIESLAAEVVEDERNEARIELDLHANDGHSVPVESRFAPYAVEDGHGYCGVARDVSDRLERERELRDRVRQQEAVGDLGQRALATDDLGALMDEAVETVADVLGMDYAKVLELRPDEDALLLRAGVGWRDGLVGSATVGTEEDSQAGYTLLSEEPVVVEDLDAESRFSGPDLLLDHDVTGGMSVVVGPPDDPWGILGAHDTGRREFSDHDVTFLRSVATILATAIERDERKRELELYETIVSAVRDGIYVLDEEFRFEMVNDAYVEMTGYDREELLGAHSTLVVDDDVSEESAERVLEMADGQGDNAAIEADVHRADGSRLRAESNFTALPSPDGDEPKKVGVVRDVSERVERERELERQREHLAALDDLNGVVRDITDAVIDRSTREEIESVVCERLAASESYEFAWIGEVDAHSREVTLRTEAGVEGYLDDVTVSVDPDDEYSTGPTGRAVIEREMQVADDVETEGSHEPWRDHVEEYEFRSSAAIPIVHEGTLYGVLNVYASRPGAFTGDEREVVSQLGDLVGHAIAAVDRKRALMSDEVVELEFRMPDAFDAFDAFGIDADVDGKVTLDDAVPTGDDVYLVYGTATDDMLDVLDALVETLPHWKDVNVIHEADGVTRFEARLVEPPVLSTVASLGGYVEEVVLADGEYYMRVHVSPSVDVRRIIDAVEDEYPAAQLASKRQVTRDDGSVASVDQVLRGELTDRQLAALEAAYHAGFFEWPRESNGEDVAASLGVSAPTFHQHVRKAQQGLLGAVIGT